MSVKDNNSQQKKILETIIESLNVGIPNSGFSIWFNNSDFYIKDEKIIINLKHNFALDFIKNTYLDQTKNIINNVTDLDIKLTTKKDIKKYQVKVNTNDIIDLSDNSNKNKQEDNDPKLDPEPNSNKNIKKELAEKKIKKSYKDDNIKEIKEINIDNVLRDIDKSMFNSSIPRKIYLSLIQQDFNDLDSYNNGKLTKVDLLVYLALSFKVNNKSGLVKNVTTTQLASFINHSSHSKVVKSLKKLENNNLIQIHKQTRPHKYTIIGYEGANRSNSMGYINITYRLFKELTSACLRQIRGVLWLLNHRYHLEDKLIQYTPNLGTLKNVMNARSFREVLDLLTQLEGSVFKLVDKLKDIKRLSFNDKFRSKLDIILDKEKSNNVFDQENLGIGNIIKPTKELLTNVYTSLKNVDIPTTQDNIRKAIGLASLLPEEIINKAYEICKQSNVQSQNKTISFYTGLLQKLYG